MADEDLVLLDRWTAGDQSAGQVLFDRHFKSVYQFFVNKTEGEAEDLAQETFFQCVKGRETFKRQSSFRTYLFAIARHVLFGYWRKRAPSTVQVEEISIASLSTSVGTRLVAQEERVRLERALQRLSLDQQMLLEMYYWHDADREMLAGMFGVEPATIGSRLFRARKALLAQLEASDQAVTDGNLDTWARSLSDD